MAYVRKRGRKKTMRRSRRRYNLVRKAMVGPKVNTLTTKRWANYTALTGNDAIPQQVTGLFFKLNDLSGSADFTNLFDQYMIKAIQYRWTLKINPDLVTTTANRGLYPYLKWVHDHDDVTVNSATLPGEIV